MDATEREEREEREERADLVDVDDRTERAERVDLVDFVDRELRKGMLSRNISLFCSFLGFQRNLSLFHSHI